MGKGHCSECGGHTAGNCCSCMWRKQNAEIGILRSDRDTLRAKVARLREAVTGHDVLKWLKDRPGISWEATIRDVEQALREIVDDRALALAREVIE